MKGIFVLVRPVPSCPACEDRLKLQGTGVARVSMFYPGSCPENSGGGEGSSQSLRCSSYRKLFHSSFGGHVRWQCVVCWLSVAVVVSFSMSYQSNWYWQPHGDRKGGGKSEFHGKGYGSSQWQSGPTAAPVAYLTPGVRHASVVLAEFFPDRPVVPLSYDAEFSATAARGDCGHGGSNDRRCHCQQCVRE